MKEISILKKIVGGARNDCDFAVCLNKWGKLSKPFYNKRGLLITEVLYTWSVRTVTGYGFSGGDIVLQCCHGEREDTKARKSRPTLTKQAFAEMLDNAQGSARMYVLIKYANGREALRPVYDIRDVGTPTDTVYFEVIERETY